MSEAAASASESTSPATVTEESEVAKRIREIVCDSLDVKPEDVTPEASFVEHLGADSLDIVDLAIRFEGAFKLSIKDRDYLYLTRLCDATAYIEARLRGETTDAAPSAGQANVEAAAASGGE